MSIKNHPNFHAVNFVTEVMVAMYESLRGKATPQNIDTESIKRVIIHCADDIELMVNSCVETTEN